MKYQERKKIVLIDMDNTICDFDGAVVTPGDDPPEMFVQGFFRNLKPLPGSLDGVRALLANDRLKVYICTKHTTKTDHSPSEKVGWIREHLPELIKRMFIVTDKLMVRGDYLIDDDRRWADFEGEFIHFDKTQPAREWSRIVEKLK